MEKVVFASSGCVYPNHLQTNAEEEIYLTEDLVQPPFDADNLYGWAKLMGELVLRAYCQEGKLKGASLRYFTAYGPRCPESHAVTAMIARAFVNQNPFVVWGTGQQVRNWTYVSDVVEASIAAAERVDDGRADQRRHDGAHQSGRGGPADPALHGQGSAVGVRPDQTHRACTIASATILSRPTSSDGSRLVPFADGLQRSIDWYFRTHDAGQVARELPRALTERTHAPA